MLKSKLVLTIASLAFVVSCTKSSDNAPAETESGPANVDISVSRLLMDGSQSLAQLDFGSVAQNKSIVKRLTIKNDEAAPLLLSLALSNNADPGALFSITSNSCPVPPLTLAVNKTCQISIQGKGAVNGTPTGSSFPGLLEIGPSHQIELQIKVTGTESLAAATDGDLSFETAVMSTENFVQGTSQKKVMKVTNTSTSKTHPGNISVSADGWVVVSSTCAAPLKPQASCKITLSFSTWKNEAASALSYGASVGGVPISAATNPSASSITCKPSVARVLKAWKATDTKSEIVTTADVGNATALTREAVQPYQVGAAQVLEICGADGISLSRALTTCPANFHKVEPKSMPGAQISDFYCEPDTVTCI